MAKCWALNCTRQTIVASDIEIAQTAWRRMKGLLGRSPGNFGKGKGLWICPSEGIHTMGMSFPIDAAYLDKKQRVIRLYHKLAPYRIAAIKFKARSVLELPAGVLAESQTQVGDLLQFLVKEE